MLWDMETELSAPRIHEGDFLSHAWFLNVEQNSKQVEFEFSNCGENVISFQETGAKQTPHHRCRTPSLRL